MWGESCLVPKQRGGQEATTWLIYLTNQQRQYLCSIGHLNHCKEGRRSSTITFHTAFLYLAFHLLTDIMGGGYSWSETMAKDWARQSIMGNGMAGSTSTFPRWLSGKLPLIPQYTQRASCPGMWNKWWCKKQLEWSPNFTRCCPVPLPRTHFQGPMWGPSWREAGHGDILVSLQQADADQGL